MQAFEISEITEAQQEAGKVWQEFVRTGLLSAGVYRLPQDGVDGQQPHTEDEVYYIVSGRGQIRVGPEDREVKPGSIVLVEAGVEHRFHSIREDLTILVFFGPAEYSLKTSL